MIKKKAKTAGPNPQPNWAKLREESVTMEFDFLKIFNSDHLKLIDEARPRGQNLEKYQSSLSEAVVGVLNELWPEREVDRNIMVIRDTQINSATAGDVKVSLSFDYADPDKPVMTVTIFAPEGDQKKIAAELKKLKKKYESGK